MDNTPLPPLPAKLNAGPPAPKEPASERDKRHEEISPATNLEMRMENGGSD